MSEESGALVNQIMDYSWPIFWEKFSSMMAQVPLETAAKEAFNAGVEIGVSAVLSA